MTKHVFALLIVFSLACTEHDLQQQPSNNNINNHNNHQTCTGEAPLANLQNGICVDVRKICAPINGVWDWVEPDYTKIENYEVEESSCDGLDNDCDGQTDENLLVVYYQDSDADGFGNPDNILEACSLPARYVTNNTDCDDTNAHIHPGVTETCNGIDDNCNGAIDEGVLNTYYRDADEDGFGNPADSILACSPPAGYVDNPSDCDDTHGNRFPGNLEVCDEIDNDCNGFIDDNVQLIFYRDADEDGFGNPSDSILACSPPAGYIVDSTDCDDTNPQIHLNATETCNGIDDNCNGSIDEGVLNTYYRDADEDGFGNLADSILACSPPAGYVVDSTDCDDTNPQIHPNVTETCNGIDDNCNSAIDEGVKNRYYRDADGDGVGTASNFMWACSPPAGYVNIAGDCNDDDAQIFPGNIEICDGKDNDCNGIIDEGVLNTYYRDADGDGYGNPIDTVYACNRPAGYVDNDEDCNDASDQAHPGGVEICDSLDNDCDGTIDVDPVLGGIQYFQDADTDTYGNPVVFTWACTQPSGYVLDHSDCDDLNPFVYPGRLEICNGIDDNCDGLIDTGSPCPANAHCEDASQTVTAYCTCNTGYIEDPDTGTCVQGRKAQEGDLLLTEIMISPHVGSNGQYFEIKNQSSVHVAINNIEIDVDGSLLTFAPSPLFLLEPSARLLVARTADPAQNGGITPDIIFSTMPELVSSGGIIEMYIPGTPDIVLDTVVWDATWRHVPYHALSLSAGVETQSNATTLNDARISWCPAKTLYNALSYGTPKTTNDNCQVDSCRLLEPTVQHIQVGQTTAMLHAQVYAEGITEPIGQGVDIDVYLGYGPFRSDPSLSSWTWVVASYFGDDVPYDLYQTTLIPVTDGTYSYAFKVTFDGGYSWRYCDKLGNDVYDPLQAGGLLVDAPCTPGSTECSDCIDNDSDGFIDGWDPECIKATDNREDAFSTGLTADDQSKQMLDCWYDGNQGNGDDGCETHVCCLLNEGTCSWMETYYGLPSNSLTKFWPYTCPSTQSTLCLNKCLPATPPGCDCFGCCTVCSGSDCRTILIGLPGTFSQCDQSTILDPIKCPSCTMDPSCSRPCDPDNCELCPGMTELDLPDHCTSYWCPDGMQSCTSTNDCPANYTCITGCCTKDFASN